jgi:hypothetical protein
MCAFPAPLGDGVASRYERKLGVSLFCLTCSLGEEVNLLYDQQ